jgi:hypothetical protein
VGERGVAIVLRLLLAGEIMLMLRGVVMDGVVGMRSKSCRSGEGTLKEGMLIRVGLPNRSAAEARGLPLPSRINKNPPQPIYAHHRKARTPQRKILKYLQL